MWPNRDGLIWLIEWPWVAGVLGARGWGLPGADCLLPRVEGEVIGARVMDDVVMAFSFKLLVGADKGGWNVFLFIFNPNAYLTIYSFEC